MMLKKAIDDLNIIPFTKVLTKKGLPEKNDFSFYPKMPESKIVEMKLSDQQEKLPVDEWIMPEQPQGYIKGRDNDIL